RLEITMDKAKIVVTDAAKISLYELDSSLTDYIYGSKEGFAKVSGKDVEIVTDGFNPQHSGVMNAFAAHILRGEPLVAEGQEGINGLMISNAAFLSSWLGKPVKLPIDEELYWEELKKRIDGSRAKSRVVEQVQADMSGTF
ncbi:MAG: gfo/Idh/MocA family oxidoreductase, partial [Clostridia bacterium]|nr:gfo/Idh/MocA family oxidoreductase [Clostridia bacterium]